MFVVTKSQLQAVNACRAYLGSPEWNSEREELVFEDWEKSKNFRLSTARGIKNLSFLVEHGLVPMTSEELREELNKRSQAAYEKIGRK